jgi:hypothetical protein
MRLLTLTTALLLATTAAAHAATPKACDLLSQSAASSLWGAPLDSVTPLGDAGCNYSRPHDEWVMTQLFDASAWGANGPKLFNMLIGGTPQGGTGEPIPGLGELATFTTSSPDPDKTFDSMVAVYARGHAFKITVRRSTNPHLKQDMIQTAKQMLAKL